MEEEERMAPTVRPCVFFGLCLLGVSTHADEGVLLRWGLKPGETIGQEVVEHWIMAEKIEGQVGDCRRVHRAGYGRAGNHSLHR